MESGGEYEKIMPACLPAETDDWINFYQQPEYKISHQGQRPTSLLCKLGGWKIGSALYFTNQTTLKENP